MQEEQDGEKTKHSVNKSYSTADTGRQRKIINSKTKKTVAM